MGPVVQLDGKGEVLVLCSNNYLGLADHPEVIAAGEAGLKAYGAGTASVRFICGTLKCHREIEENNRPIRRYRICFDLCQLLERERSVDAIGRR